MEFVLTSKGHQAILVKPEGYSVGYFNQQDKWVEVDFDINEAEAQFKCLGKDNEVSYMVQKTSPIIKLGVKKFTVSSGAIKVIDIVNLIMPKVITVPTNVAEELIEIFQRNNIFYSL